LGKYIKDLKIVRAVGGDPIGDLRKSVENNAPHVVVGTPGRIEHMINIQLFSFERTEILVLDEADEMLSQGFKDNVVNINSFLPQTCQTVLLSATMPQEIIDVFFFFFLLLLLF
jgi:translation initiation factor 4A